VENATTFVIGETGFGAGLNFLSAAELWLHCAPATAQLHFIALESTPLCRDDLVYCLQAHRLQAHKQHTQYQISAFANEPLARELIENYPLLSPGFHRLVFAEGRICLTLILSNPDISPNLAGLLPSLHPSVKAIKIFGVDAWFIHQPLSKTSLQQLAALSGQGTSLVSLTRGEMMLAQLQAFGFEVKEQPCAGGQKILRGQWQEKKPSTKQGTAQASPADTTRPQRKTRHQPPWQVSARPHCSNSRHAAVIGAGIAGCTTAAALAQRGWRVTLHERHNTLANEGSGNPQGIVYPKLSAQSSSLSRINLSALLFASRFYQRFWHSPSEGTAYGQQCGVLVLPESDKDQASFKTIAKNFQRQSEFLQWLDQRAIQNICGLPLQVTSGLYYPQLGWLNPPRVCQALTEHPLIRIEQAAISHLNYDSAGERWQLIDAEGRELPAIDTVVLATSTSTGEFEQSNHLPIKAIRGQISIAASANRCDSTVAKHSLQTVLCGAGYIAPEDGGEHTFGASYNLNTTDLAIRTEDHQHNLDLLEQNAEGLTSTLHLPPAQQLNGRAALRCTTLDYLPIIGPAPRYDDFLNDYAQLRHDASSDIPHPGQYWPGLYIHCGLGSRGLSYAPLGAELLASQINGEPPVLEQDLLSALNPARFIIRDLKRRKI
jgi:tRNA 5-methylaminomethyl-2-thiouridine biosynthesis bifunctional protein